MSTVNFVGASLASGPYAINGYYPLYASQDGANQHIGGNGTSHSHVFFGQTFYMPNGLTLGVEYFHGNYDGSLTSAYNQGQQRSGTTTINGYYYYKQEKTIPEYHTSWRLIDEPTTQAIVTRYSVTQLDIDNKVKDFFIGCVPNVDAINPNGYAVDIKINNISFNDWVYDTNPSRKGFIVAGSTLQLKVGDFVEIKCISDAGLLSNNGISKFDVPLSWGHNHQNKEILTVSSPEYLEHFKTHIENQEGFEGDPLASNNYENSQRKAGLENKIIQTNQDIVLGAFLVDDHVANLVDSLRFCSNEYEKYKNRLRHEVESYYSTKSTAGLSREYLLEQVLKNVTAFKIGNDVFDTTYVLPFGDNYLEEAFTVAIDQTDFVLTSFFDLTEIENSLLVYLEDQLLTVGRDYTLSNFSPITIQLVEGIADQGQVLTTKLYNADRDSAQCPPTPSTMGIMPLYEPGIIVDNSFKDPIEFIIGHDGSKTKTFDDFRDDLLLEFETRVYNSAKGELRQANSLPEYNSVHIKRGAFRNSDISYNEYHDLLRHNYSSWVFKNGLDGVANEFFDEDDKWSWNYGDATFPGYWRGWYDYYYDTVRPNTAPWEMLGFTEKPTWWATQYSVFADSDYAKLYPIEDYSSKNTGMWEDLEKGIIRQGPRENVSFERFKSPSNPYARKGLGTVLPVDADAKLRTPGDIADTKTTKLTATWTNTPGTHVLGNFSFKTDSFRQLDGLSVAHDSSNIYVTSNNLSNRPQAKEQELTYNFPRIDLTVTPHADDSNLMTYNAVGIAVNGEPIYNIKSDKTWNGEGDWHYNKVQEKDFSAVSVDKDGKVIRHIITPEVVGLDDWDSTTASPLVGWSFDGYPIYGPYGYSDTADATSSVIRVGSAWELDTRTRGTVQSEQTGPGGKPTGQFVKDYTITNGEGTSSNNYSSTDRYNLRYAVTVDSPTQAIWHYVVTVDADHAPVFPYHIGGGIESERWAGKYRSSGETIGQITSMRIDDRGGLYTLPPEVVINGDGGAAVATTTITADGKVDTITISAPGRGYTYADVEIVRATGDTTGVRAKAVALFDEFDITSGKGYVNPSAIVAFASTKEITKSNTNNISNHWKFNDGSPVENAWKQTSGYSFAVAEALLLAKPGRFASVFSAPTVLLRPPVNTGQLLSKVTKKRWKFFDPTDFKIHGDVDNNGDMVTNIGYTQFINSWLRFQGLDTPTELVAPLRSLNMKLAHRMSGFVDKDTLTARTDQYSNSGNASSLIIPKENLHITLHSSNYKSRNSYSGVVIVKSVDGYRVRGFDKNRGYFEILESIKDARTSTVEVGGDPMDFVVWTKDVTYNRDTIVQYQGNYFQAPVKISSGQQFDRSVWTALSSLPQKNSAKGILYQRTNGNIVRVPYETVFKDTQDVFDFLISLGRYQTDQGYDFGGFDSTINDVRDWTHSARQFLFWTTGKWEIGNTIELSPLADKIVFKSDSGFIAKINRVEREQFSILDENGEVIDPNDCEIFREDNIIEVVPPEGSQIYSAVLFTKEIEHATVFDNVTNFNDVIYDDLLDQRHKRIKIKATRTADWDGRFSSSGFIIQDDELKPNLDNLAEGLGRYHELGFIPVEKQLYTASRALFGYTEREYLSELDIQDDAQFEFYQGILQNKGTQESLSAIARSSAVIQGNVSVYDEWALRVGDFGDTDKNQSIELKLSKTEMTEDPQLVSLQFPQNITNVVDRVDIIDPRYTYNEVPTIEISSPLFGGKQATASASIDASTKKLSAITVTEPGSNYPDAPVAKVIASEVVIDTRTYRYDPAIAVNSGYINLSPGTFPVTGTFTDNVSGNTSTVSISAISSATDYANAINQDATINSSIKASVIRSDVYNTVSGDVELQYNLQVTGADFTVSGASNNFGIADGTYNERQVFAIKNTATNTDGRQTSENDISVTVDNNDIPQQNIGNNNDVVNNNWEYIAGITNTVTLDQSYPRIDRTASPAEGEIEYPLVDKTGITFSLPTPLGSHALHLNEDNTYRFAEVYINGIRIRNAVNSKTFGDHDNDSTTAWEEYVTSYNTLFSLTNNTITFPDIDRLPDSIKTTLFNPPTDVDVESAQRSMVSVLAPGTTIEVKQKPVVKFLSAFVDDMPGSLLKIKVTAIDGIAVRIGTRRTFEITPDDQNDDVIVIDIDDASKFIKKPHGVRQNKLWPTTANVDYMGMDSDSYPRVKNAGYVDLANVNFQAYDLANLPNLYTEDKLVKPGTNDLVHVAVSEDDDWNVYKLKKTSATTHYVKKSASGAVDLYTDTSLFDYIDTNELGSPDTGKYLDYFLTLKNAQLTDNLVVWTNESIVQEKSTKITDFEAPRMITARIASISPQVEKTITAIDPYAGRTLAGLTITPLAGTDIITVSGDIGAIANTDAIKLLDNIGVVERRPASVVGGIGTSTFTFDPIGIESVTVQNGGAHYGSAPSVEFSASSTGDRALGVATIIGGVHEFEIVDGGTGYSNSALPQILIDPPQKPVDQNGNPSVRAKATATVDSNGTITGIIMDDHGSGYTKAPGFRISGAATTEAQIFPRLNGTVDKVYMIKKGSGYSGNTPTITVSAPNSTLSAKVTATLGAVKTVPTDLGIHQTYLNAGNDASKVRVTINWKPVNELAFAVEPQLTASEQANLDLIRSLDSTKYYLSSYDNTTGVFSIDIPTVADANDLLTHKGQPAVENILITSTIKTSFDDPAPLFATDVTANSFNLLRPGTGYTQDVRIRHLNRVKVTCPGHGFNVGDKVRIETNAFLGEYEILNVLSPSSFVVDAPWTDQFTAPGSVYGRGIKITTVAPHEISPIYIASNKRIAIHFAEPKVYNKIYRVDKVTPNELYIDGRWSPAPGTVTYYETAIGTLSGQVPYDGTNEATATNIIDVTNDNRLIESLITYDANSNLVASSNITNKGTDGKVVIDPAGLPQPNLNGNYPTVNITVIRQRRRLSDKYAIVTTADHDIVTINGSSIRVDNYNNPSAVSASINRQIDLRKQYIRQPKNNSTKPGLKVGFVMAQDPLLPMINDLPARAISDYGPYIKDRAMIEKLSGGNLKADKDLVLITGNEKPFDSKFNKGEKLIGPVRGLEYTDETSEVLYRWNASLNEYIPVSGPDDSFSIAHDAKEKPMDPENHVDASGYLNNIRAWQPSTTASGISVAYYTNDVVSQGNKAYIAVIDVYDTDNNKFTTMQANSRVVWQDVTNGTNGNLPNTNFVDPALEAMSHLVPTFIPGTGTNKTDATLKKQKKYNMLKKKTFTDSDGELVTVFLYTLGYSQNNLFEIFQAVQNDGTGGVNGDIFYAKIDSVNPEDVGGLIDYYLTVSTYSNKEDRLQSTEFYYFYNKTVSVDSQSRITFLRDPVRLARNLTSVTLGPVEPAMYMGRQLVPEPFAVQDGNNSDAIANALSIPGLKIDGNKVSIDGTQPGLARFFMWTPGLTPQKWMPDRAGPGNLPGVRGNATAFGYGRGYYEENDDHASDTYPNVSQEVQANQSGWSRSMPRFLYSSKFTVQPLVEVGKQELFVSLIDGSLLTYEEAQQLGLDNVDLQIVDTDFVDSSDESPANTGFRPEELFVACFWTEPHTYENQWINIDYTGGSATPVISNYGGTVTRVKYIRLTELPATAQTRRLIPDTGWAPNAKQWSNRPIDQEELPLTDDSIRTLFTPLSVTGGSTGDDLDGTQVVLNIGNNDSTNLNPNNTATVDDTGNVLINTGLNKETIPVTNLGPILNSDVFSDLPGPCVSLGNPNSEPPVTGPGDCTSTETETKFVYLSSDELNYRGGTIEYVDEDEADVTFDDNGRFDPVPWNNFANGNEQSANWKYNYNKGKWGYVNVKVAGKNPLRVYFDNLKDSDCDWLGVVVIQSDRPYFSFADADLDNWGTAGQSTQNWWASSTTRILAHTDVSSTIPGRDGLQIKRYGLDTLGDDTKQRVEIDMLHNFRNADGTRYDQETFAAIHAGSISDTSHQYHGASATDFTANKTRGAYVPTSDDTTVPTRVQANHIWSTGPFNFDQPISSLGVADITETTTSDSNEWKAKQFNIDIGARGIGVIQCTPDCRNGEYVTVFYRVNDSVNRSTLTGNDSSEQFRTTIEFTGEITRPPDVVPPDPGGGDTCDPTSGGSFGWHQGGIKKTFSARNSNGYFGSLDRDGETWDRSVSKQRYKKKITETIAPTTQRNCKLDNIYFPYQSLPNPYKSHSVVPSTPYASSDFQQAGRGWGSWTHNNYRSFRSSGVTKYQGTVSGMAGKITIPQYTTYEYTGYFRAPHTGTYDFQAYSDDGVWVWISSEPTTEKEQLYVGGANGRDIRSGVDDEGKNFEGVDVGGEYFKNDGYNVNDKYGYHRQNAQNSLGWLTSDDNVRTLQPSERLVKLKEGHYYFTRIITGNNKGPGYAEVKYFVQTDGPYEPADLWVEPEGNIAEYNPYGTGHHYNVFDVRPRSVAHSGYVYFSGKKCPDDQPPGTPPPGSNPPGSNPPGSNPPGSNPPGSNPPGTGQFGTVTGIRVLNPWPHPDILDLPGGWTNPAGGIPNPAGLQDGNWNRYYDCGTNDFTLVGGGTVTGTPWSLRRVSGSGQGTIGAWSWGFTYWNWPNNDPSQAFISGCQADAPNSQSGGSFYRGSVYNLRPSPNGTATTATIGDVFEVGPTNNMDARSTPIRFEVTEVNGTTTPPTDTTAPPVTTTTAAPPLGGGPILDMRIDFEGQAIMQDAWATYYGSTGTGAEFNFTITNGKLTDIRVINGGNGYRIDDEFLISSLSFGGQMSARAVVTRIGSARASDATAPGTASTRAPASTPTQGPATELTPNSSPYSWLTISQWEAYKTEIASTCSGVGAYVGRTGAWLDCQLVAFMAVGVCPPGSADRCEYLRRYADDRYYMVDTPTVQPATVITQNIGTGNQPIGYGTETPGLPYNIPMETVMLPDGSSVVVPLINIGDIGPIGIGNSTQAGQPHMSGFNFMPYSMKTRVKQNIQNLSQFSFSNQGLSETRPFANGVQRTSNGITMPLARKLTQVSMPRPALETTKIVNQPWSKNLVDRGSLNKTSRFFDYNGQKITTVATVGGKAIQNITTDASLYNQLDRDKIQYVGPAFETPVLNMQTNSGASSTGASSSGVDSFGRPVSISAMPFAPLALSPADLSVEYNRRAQIDITPMDRDVNGNLIPAGPSAQVILRQPTPEATITAEDLIGVEAGSELLVNNKRIVIRGKGLQEIKSQVNCASIGISALINEDTNELTLVSCTDTPITFGNGCGGGTWKSVGDFHINRGFDQSITESQELMLPFINPVQPITTTTETSTSVSTAGAVSSSSSSDTTGGDGGGQDVVDPVNAETEVIFDYERLSDGTLVLRNYTGELQSFELPTGEYQSEPVPEAYKTPARIPIESKTRSTAGSGYRIGDRLRLIGGTPVNTGKMPLAKICIDSAGSGYKKLENIRIIINESGQAPGIGAAAVVTELDENGGIRVIEMINNGAAYDAANPPEIQIIETGQDSGAIKLPVPINVAWPPVITVPAGDFIELTYNSESVNSDGEYTGEIIVQNRSVRALQSIEFGKKHYYTVDSGDIAWNDVGVTNGTLGIDNPPRSITVIKSVNTIPGAYRPNPGEKVAVTFYPGTSLNDFNATVVSKSMASNNIVSVTVEGDVRSQIKEDMALSVNIDIPGSDPVSSELRYIGIVETLTLDSNLDTIITLVQSPSFLDGIATRPSLTTEEQSAIVADEVVYFGNPITKLMTIPGLPIPDENGEFTAGLNSVGTNGFVLTDAALSSEAVAINYFGVPNAPIMLMHVESWESAAAGNLVDATPQSIPFNKAKLSAIVGEIENRAELEEQGLDAFELSNQERLKRQPSGPLRVAKFIVTDIDDNGAITGLRCIDRGLYSEFPSDLTYGLPLEYDYEAEGMFKLDARGETDNQVLFAGRSSVLGIGDPLRNNRNYGQGHPEYAQSPFTSVDRWLESLRDPNDDPTGAIQAGLEAIVEKYNLHQFDPDLYPPLTASEQAKYDNLITTIERAIYDNFGEANKHPFFVEFPEFKHTGLFDTDGVPEFVVYTGTPGEYDPTTYVVVDLVNEPNANSYRNDPNAFAKRLFAEGKLLRKTKAINYDVNDIGKDNNPYGEYMATPQGKVAGGTGARVFLTAQEVPNCTERGTAQEALNLPDAVTTVNAPRSLARAMNDAFQGAGYLPDEIRAVFTPIGELGNVEIESINPELDIDTPTPGVLDRLPLPVGTYNTAMLCIDTTFEKTNEEGETIPYTDQQFFDDISKVYDDNLENLGLIELNTEANNNEFIDTYVLNIICADRIQPDIFNPTTVDPESGAGPIRRGPGSRLAADPAIFGLNDNNSIFGDGNQLQISELYKYNIQNIFGQDVRLKRGSDQQGATVLYFESKRFNKQNMIAPLQGPGMLSELDLIGTSVDLFTEGNAWVDSFSNSVWNLDMPNFIDGGWTYFENGVPQRWQTPMVDINYVNNALLYHPETGKKTVGFDLFDPFKGVLPGFIDNEIHFISDIDPVSYNNARTNFGKNNVGKVWWDTSTVRYQWYEQGADRDRARNWGKAIPGSVITVCEWVESEALPMNWNGDGIPRWSDKYTSQRVQDYKTGEYKTLYYYWVMNRSRVDERVARDLGRKIDIQTIGKYISDPVGFGLNVLNFVSDSSVTLNNVSNIRDEENHLQINVNKNSNPDSIKHTAWKLMREGDNNSIVPDYLSDKLIDSLCGENQFGQLVPDPILSEVEAYGIQFRPRQGMFKDLKDARRIMVSVLNRILANTRLNSQHHNWDKTLPSARAYIQTTNWYAVKQLDPNTKEAIRYDASSKPVFTVTGVSELRKLQDIVDGTIIQVKSSQNDVAQLWEYVGAENDYKLISVRNDTIRLRPTVYTDDSNPTLSSELRLLLTALKETVFTNSTYWNELFFELMKHAYSEQGQLSWAFKTSYLYVEKEEDDLIQFSGFRPDNFDKVLSYMNEVKPYNAKIREYKDGKRTPIDLIGQNSVSDYDKPPFVDESTGEVRILNLDVDADRDILANTASYTDYLSVQDEAVIENTPIRRSNTQLVFDRTHWQFTQPGWDLANVSMESSIGYNIANLSVLTNSEVQANAQVRAVDRLFKYDTEIKAVFATEVNTFFNNSQAYRDMSIIGDGTRMADVVEAGQLKNTLALLKEKVGGNFRGETLNAGEYSKLIEEADYFSDVQTLFGFDTAVFDENTDYDNTIFTDDGDLENYGPVTTVGIGDAKWDNTTEIVSYEGIFNKSQGNVTLRKNNDLYEGFDGVTFQRVLYGEERPEELALIDPLESIIMTVTTSPFSRGAAGLLSAFDGDVDVANAQLQHSTISVNAVNIINGGKGYLNPTVTIVDADGSGGGASLSATITNGVVTAINVNNPGNGYASPQISLVETFEESLTQAINLHDKDIYLADTSNVVVGQTFMYSTTTLGTVESVDYANNIVTLNQLIVKPISSGNILDFFGTGFYASIDIIDETSPESSVMINKPFIDTHEYLNTIYTSGVDYVTVSGNLFVYDFQNSIAFPDITVASGANPQDANDFYVLDAGGWDSANENGDAGSFDVEDTLVQERVVASIPFGQEVVFRQHQTLFGQTDYLRLSTNQQSLLATDIRYNSLSIELDDASFLPQATSLTPGAIWVGDERINYGRLDNNTLSLLTRGAAGTTPQDWSEDTPVYSAMPGEYFNNLNPQANVWLDQGTRYDTPEGWDEINAGLNNVLESQFGNSFDDPDSPTVIGGDDMLRAWDELANGNITVSTVSATVSTANTTSSNITLTNSMTLTVGEAVKITNPGNIAETEVVSVTTINGNDIIVKASYNDTLNANIFVVNGTINVSSFDYGTQAGADSWDAAAISGQTAISLSDRANADFTVSTSIMRFLHKLD